MFLIQQISDNPYQKQTLVLEDGTSLTLTLRYQPLQLGWFIEELVYQSFVLKSVRICVSPDILFQFKNQIPFGLGCLSKGNREPTQQQDFSSGAAQLYILSQAEVIQFAELLKNG